MMAYRIVTQGGSVVMDEAAVKCAAENNGRTEKAEAIHEAWMISNAFYKVQAVKSK